jgi:hypothetical protein
MVWGLHSGGFDPARQRGKAVGIKTSGNIRNQMMIGLPFCSLYDMLLLLRLRLTEKAAPMRRAPISPLCLCHRFRDDSSRQRGIATPINLILNFPLILPLATPEATKRPQP